MGHEALIERIVAEVVRQLRQARSTAASASQQPGCASEQASQPRAAVPGATAHVLVGPRVLVVLTGGDRGLDEAFAQVERLGRAGAQLRSVCSPAARMVLGSSGLERLDRLAKLEEPAGEAEVYGLVGWAEIVAVPVLTQNAAAKVALGIRDSLVTNLLAGAIIMGRKLVACSESTMPWSGPPAYRRTIADYLERLRSYGIQLVPTPSLAAACLGQPAMPGPAAAGSTLSSARAPVSGPNQGRRPVVTAAQVEAAFRCGQRSLRLPARAIVTPLARDEARERGVELIGN